MSKILKFSFVLLSMLLIASVLLPIPSNTNTTSAQESFPLSQLVVILQTSINTDAGTDDGFEVSLLRADGSVFYTFLPTHTDWDENETGRTETYQWNLGRISSDENITFEASMFRNSTLCIRTYGDDAWLLNRVWVNGRSSTTNEMILLASVADWPSSLLLSTDLSEGNPAYTLDLQPILNCRQ